MQFKGIEESMAETWEITEQKLKSFITEKLEPQAPTLEMAHRVGRSYDHQSKPRTIILKFVSFKEKEQVLTADCCKKAVGP